MVDNQSEDRIRKRGTMKRSQKLSVQALLKRFFWYGLVGLIAGVMIGVLISNLNLPIGWHLITVGISGFGLAMLVSAWYTRQGLVHGRMMKLMTRLMHLI
jgi:hypothetical protein